MLLEIKSFDEIDARKLMDLYREGNEENAAYFYPGQADALQKAEHDFLDYVNFNFFNKPGNRYMVLEQGGVWISALRLYPLEDRLYYLEALETHPDYRRRGFASQLLAGVTDGLKKQGAFRLCDCVGKNNAASLRTHQTCGFEIISEKGYDYLRSEADDRRYGMQFVYEE